MHRTYWLLGLLTVALLTWPAHHAAADWWKNESGKGKYEYQSEKDWYKYGYKDSGCKYERKWGAEGYKEERKCKSGRAYAWAPPPWAPRAPVSIPARRRADRTIPGRSRDRPVQP